MSKSIATVYYAPHTVFDACFVLILSVALQSPPPTHPPSTTTQFAKEEYSWTTERLDNLPANWQGTASIDKI